MGSWELLSGGVDVAFCVVGLFCSEKGGSRRLSSCCPQCFGALRGSRLPPLRLRQEKGAERRVLLVCTHRAPASTGTAASTVLPCVRPLLPAAVTSDPYYFCKVEQGRKNGCAVSFFMRQDLLRTIGEINPSM